MSDVTAKEQNSQTLASCSLDILEFAKVSPPNEPRYNNTTTQRKDVGSLCPPTSYYTSKSPNSFLGKIQCSHVGNEPLFVEIMNESIFESLIKEVFDAGSSTQIQLSKACS